MSRFATAHADRLAAAVADNDAIDALIVGDLVRPGDSGREAMADLSWLTSFTGTSGLGVVGPDRRLFVTDFRYLKLAESRLPDGFELIMASAELVGALEGLLSGRIGYDESSTSVRVRAALADALGEGCELVSADGVVAGLRRLKDDREIAAIAAATELSDAVFAELEAAGLVGRSEREVALWIESRMRELGAQGPSFDSIVAAGPNGALPHAVPGERRIEAGELVVVDSGAILDGYCSDCTRTYAAGSEPTADAAEAYGLVLEAQLAALDTVTAGADGRAVDAAARELIAAGDHGEHFGHGLGHGVGIEVHEAPRLSTRSEDELAEGDVVTVEPGIYVPGAFGVRIEDLVVVTGAAPRILTSRPKQLTVV